jgi:GNAT superfamily N-acetyltransferase
MQENLVRMIALAEEFFDMKNDPEQLSVNDDVLERLRRIHPATITQEQTADGPIAWMLVVPTTRAVMEEFLAGRINEQQLLDRTPEGIRYEAIYLCSALVLPEHRNLGLSKRMLAGAIEAIRTDHPIGTLYYWAFSTEGDALARSVARSTGLPVLKREEAKR